MTPKTREENGGESGRGGGGGGGEGGRGRARRGGRRGGGRGRGRGRGGAHGERDGGGIGRMGGRGPPIRPRSGGCDDDNDNDNDDDDATNDIFLGGDGPKGPPPPLTSESNPVIHSEDVATIVAAAAAPSSVIADLDRADDNASHVTSSTHAAAPHTYCLVCYSDDLPRHRAILPCGHDDACATCHLRLRHLHSDRRCPVCKADNEKVIVDADPAPPSRSLSSLAVGDGKDNGDGDDEKQQGEGGTSAAALDAESKTHRPFQSYQVWGDDLGTGYVHRESVGMFFPVEYYRTDVLPLFGLGCNVPGCRFVNDADTYVTESRHESDKPDARQKREVKRMSGVRALEQHLRSKHGLTLCNLCVDHKRDFVSCLPRFSPSELKTHLIKGDGDGSGFKGHPLCEFCRPRRFYDLTKLHEHLNKDHYKCHVCEKQGRRDQFFKNYDQLARHFDREHFLCHDPQCLAARFVVFENEIDLRAHEVGTHGGNRIQGGGTKINLEFRVRRVGYDGSGYEDERQVVPSEEDFQYGLDGEAFVPEALPERRQANEPAITDAFHAMRTAALREEAARLREESRRREHASSFPALSEGVAAADGGGGGGGNLVGWTAEGRAALSRAGRTPGTRMTEDNFPSLPTAGHKKDVAARAKAPRAFGAIGATGGTAAATAATTTMSSTLAAMRAAASQAPLGGLAYASSAVTVAPASSSFFAPTPAPAAATATLMNRQSNLTADNFPSLGGPSSAAIRAAAARVSYGPGMASASAAGAGAAGTGTKKPLAAKPPPVKLTADDFPSLGPPSVASRTTASSTAAGAGRARKGVGSTPSAPAPKYAAAEALAKKLRQQKQATLSSTADDFEEDDMEDFPPSSISSASPDAKMAAKHAGQKPLSEEALSSVLHFPPPPSSGGGTSLEKGKSIVESMKAALGPTNYKVLKGLTKDFATGDVDPDQYVDRSAALFEGGITNEAFWSYFPTLIQSCPNERSVAQASRYLEKLRLAHRTQESEFATAAAAKDAPSTGYASAAAAAAPGAGTRTAAVGSWSAATASAAQRVHAPYGSVAGSAAVPYRGPSSVTVGINGRGESAQAPPGKKKGAWGGATVGGVGSSAIALRAKAPSISVAAAAAEEVPQIGTATIGMALAKAEERRQKQLESQRNQGGAGVLSKKNKQKKKNEELRSLAFGGK